MSAGPRPAADGDVVTPSIIKERMKTLGCVVGAGGVAKERVNTVGRVEVAGCVVRERFATGGRVVVAGCVAIERVNTGSRVVETGYAVNGRVVKERLIPGGRIVGAAGVKLVEGGVVKERLNPYGRVLEAGCVVIERIKTQGRVVARIASVRCWAYRSSRWRKRKPCEREWDEEETAHNPVSTKNENKYDNFKVNKINWPVAFAARFTACPANLDC